LVCSPSMEYSLTWDLDCFFSGGSGSKELNDYIDRLQSDLEQLKSLLHDHKHLVEAIELSQMLSLKLREVNSFIICLTSQNIDDKKASLLEDQIISINATFETVSVMLDRLLAGIDDEIFAELLATPELKKIQFPLEERREWAYEKLNLSEESLINDLAIDGYHSWSRFYDTLIGEMAIPFEGKTYSLGQMENRLSDPDRNKRKAAFDAISNAFKEKESLFAHALNHIAGFRLKTYERRSWDSVLKEPLHGNRMQSKTLETLWKVIDQNKEPLLKYMKKKAELLNIPKLAWYDLEAPIGSTSKKVPYDEGAKFIIDQFRKFSPKMAEFAEKALSSKWIEAEDRSGKRPGGYCTDFPIKGESRIFMTYSGTQTNISTLAHELGHAYHNEVTKDLPEMARHFTMNVAETASTMAEMIVTDAAVKSAETPEEKLSLLDDQIGRAVAFFMNIHARFIFETNFYEKRKEGYILPETLSEIMETAQNSAYHDGLECYHPHFWASKLHFYFTDVPFYNFPYTFGYLFSLGIYSLSPSEDKYIALLKDTGLMTVEDLAKKHLNVDLTKPTFWENAMQPILKDIEGFIA